MAKSGTAGSKKGKRSPREKSDAVANIMLPHTSEGIKVLAEKMVAGEVPGIGLINGAIMSQTAFSKEITEHQKAQESENSTVIPSVTPLYDPVVADAIRRLNCRVAIQGQASKHTKVPGDWRDGPLGVWKAGRYIDDAIRVHHIKDLTRNVVDPEKNIVQIGSHQYLIGDEDTSAVVNASPSKTGNYAANILACKRLSLSESKGLNNIVAQFNNHVVAETLDDGTTPGGVVHFLPNQLATWGYLEREGRRLTYAQIRKFVEGEDVSETKFVRLLEPIVGEGFTQSKFTTTVQRLMQLASTKNDEGLSAWDRFSNRGSDGKSNDNKDGSVWRNLFVQMRLSPHSWQCFGFENLQWGIAPVSYFDDDIDNQLVRLVVGVRLGTEYGESRAEARARLAPVLKKAEKPKAEKTKKPKAEKAKPAKVTKSVKKSSKRKPRAADIVDTPAPEVETATEETAEESAAAADFAEVPLTPFAGQTEAQNEAPVPTGVADENESSFGDDSEPSSD